jgi:hypothetical protein
MLLLRHIYPSPLQITALPLKTGGRTRNHDIANGVGMPGSNTWDNIIDDGWNGSLRCRGKVLWLEHSRVGLVHNDVPGIRAYCFRILFIKTRAHSGSLI